MVLTSRQASWMTDLQVVFSFKKLEWRATDTDQPLSSLYICTRATQADPRLVSFKCQTEATYIHLRGED